MIKMTNELGEYATKWVKKVVDHRFGSPEIEKTTPELAYLVVYDMAKNYWHHLDYRSVQVENLVGNEMPPWITLLLPRRPATVFFAFWQNMLRDNLGEEYRSYYNKNEPVFKEFIRKRLFLYKLSRSFREIVGLPTLKGSVVDIDTNKYIETVLQRLATPNGILQEIVKFGTGKNLAAAIAYLRLIEELSSDVSGIGNTHKTIDRNSSPNTDVRKGNDTIDRNSSPNTDTRKEMGSIDQLFSALDKFQSKVKQLEDYNFHHIEHQVQLPNYADDETLLELVSSQNYGELKQFISRSIRYLRSMSQVKTKEKRQLMITYQNEPTWFRIKEIHMLHSEKRYSELKLYLCYTTDKEFAITSKVLDRETNNWKQDVKYFQYFSQPNDALHGWKDTVQKYTNQGYNPIT